MSLNNDQSDKKNTAEECWRAVFDKVFEDLRTNHPADEWILRIVDQLPLSKGVEEVPATESEAIIIDSAATTEHATPECIQEIAKEVNQELPSSTDTNNGDDGECSHQNNAVVTEATDSENSQDGSQQQEKAVDDDNPLDMQRNQQPVEQGGNLESEHEEDNRVDSTVETTQVDQVQVHLEASGEETKQGDQGEVNEQEAIVENKHEENETGSSDGPEAQEPAAVIQAEEEVVESTTTTTETLNCSEQSEPIQTEETVPQEVLGDTSNGIETTAEQITEASTDNEQTKDESVVEEVTNELEKVIDAYDEKTETLENGIQIRESTPPTETHFDTPHAELITDSPSEVIANEERLIDDDNKQVDEIEVAPVRVVAQSRPAAAQRLGASSPQLATNSHAEPKASGSAAKSPGKTSQDNEFLRKPEWLRRPLVRKGSVGRFIGRMRTTMQSKRFHPDRLPVVPPPQPEPPKRPPRRKTLANIDVTREIESATKQEQNLVEATPKSAPVVADFESKSATLRSTTSDRKRKNSVGRFIGRVLSTKYLNATEGTAAAEEAPLLNQENQPTTPQPSTPAPSEKSKKGPVMAVNDVGIFIRRILRPKMPGAEESKEKPLPQRPPPPSSRHQTPTPNEADRKDDNSFIKSGRVRFECQGCHHIWKSGRGIARCEIVVNQVGDGIRQGEILIRLYGQQCKRCSTNVFEIAEWNNDGITKVLTNLRDEVGRKFYPDEDGPKAHQRRLCQACQEGICQGK